MKVFKTVAIVGGITAAVVVGAFLLGFVVQALWNWLFPEIFGLPKITYWQALGLFILARFLLSGGPRVQYRRDRKRESFRDKVRERFPPTPPSGEDAQEKPATA